MIGYGVAALAAAAGSLAGYQSMAPTGQWYGRTFTGLQSGTKKLALTYDDGPNERDTPRLLEVLAKHGVTATFFMIGRYVRLRPDLAREVARAGHAIGNHTYSHPPLTFETQPQIRAQLEECEKVLAEAIGDHAKIFRPPFGARRPAVLRIVREMGLEPVMWNVTGYDWNASSVEAIETKVYRRIRGGNVVLLHDGGHLGMGADRSKTVEATNRLIGRYKGEGYRFVSIPEMMGGEADNRRA
jgi:peptidoglycan/xylan/chitin deacetylase (PgdA/CDA1 family)